MYSRYKIRTPSPPPDYAGTAFMQDPVSSPAEAENRQPVNAQGSPDGPLGEGQPESRWEGPHVAMPEAQPEEDPNPEFTLPPEEEEPELKSESESEQPQPGSDVREDAGNTKTPGSLLEQMNPDDLLFIGAMLYLLSGKTGDDSFLLMAYLLTCGL